MSEMGKKCICLRKSKGDHKTGCRSICLWTGLRMQHMWKLWIWTWILLKILTLESPHVLPWRDATCHSLKTLTSAPERKILFMESVEVCMVNLRAFLGRCGRGSPDSQDGSAPSAHRPPCQGPPRPSACGTQWMSKGPVSASLQGTLYVKTIGLTLWAIC